MRRFCRVVLATLFLSALAGCHKEKPKEVSIPPAKRTEAANLASEADFAMQVRDFPRAEKALAHSVELDPEVSTYWINLGIARKKQGNSSGARTAYKQALSVCEAAYKRTPKETGAALEEVHILLFLGDEKEARRRLEKARQDHPEDRDIRIFVEDKVIDQMLADPELKAVMP